MNIIRKSFVLTLGTMIAVGGFSWSGGTESLVSQAEARIGRPLTPVSYAGVARRTTRRAAYVGAAAAASAPSTTVVVAAPAAAPAPQYPPECVRSTDSSGATIYRCP